jgi:hypothetical protein
MHDDRHRRFHAHFFVTFLQTTPSSGNFTSGDRKQFLPTPDGGQEVISARFVHPTEALAAFERKEITLMPPQFYILKTLSELLLGSTNTVEQRERIASLSSSPFGSLVINPRGLVPPPKGTPEGATVLTYEGDQSRGGPPSRLHRVVLLSDAKGVSRSVRIDDLPANSCQVPNLDHSVS